MNLHSLTTGSVAGYVLAGGQSRRMGSDKTALVYRGRPLIEYVAEQVRAATGSAAIVGGAWADVPDRYPSFGPVGGIVTALESGTAEWNLVVACDMPYLSAEWLWQLVKTAVGSRYQVIVPVTEDGRLHPLCAIYHRSALPQLQLAVDSGIHTVREAIKPLRRLDIPVPDDRLVANVNTPDQWAAVLADEE